MLYGKTIPVTPAALGHILGIAYGEIEFHVEKLRRQGFLEVTKSRPFPIISLSQQGKGYLINGTVSDM
jgi:hypothetical protein